MNRLYPDNSEDRDEEFIYKLSLGVFSLEEIQSFLKADDLRKLKRDNLAFVKSNDYII